MLSSSAQHVQVTIAILRSEARDVSHKIMELIRSNMSQTSSNKSNQIAMCMYNYMAKRKMTTIHSMLQ